MSRLWCLAGKHASGCAQVNSLLRSRLCLNLAKSIYSRSALPGILSPCFSFLHFTQFSTCTHEATTSEAYRLQDFIDFNPHFLKVSDLRNKVAGKCHMTINVAVILILETLNCTMSTFTFNTFLNCIYFLNTNTTIRIYI